MQQQHCYQKPSVHYSFVQKTNEIISTSTESECNDMGYYLVGVKAIDSRPDGPMFPVTHSIDLEVIHQLRGHGVRSTNHNLRHMLTHNDITITQPPTHANTATSNHNLRHMLTHNDIQSQPPTHADTQ